LRDKYLAGGVGTYTRPSGGTTWTKSGGGDSPGATYIITGSGTSFTATKDGTTIGSGAIQNVINAIRTHAPETKLTIQFGNGNVLDIGTAYVDFNNTGGMWGAVTLTGKIKSAVIDSTSGTISVGNPVSVTSMAEIANSAESGVAIYHNSNATLTISGGTVSATSGYAVYNSTSGTVNISGGTISATSGYAVCNFTTGKVNISGGTISATSGNAVYNYGANGNVNISGGTVSAALGCALYNRHALGEVTVSGTAKVTSANTNTAQGTVHLANEGWFQGIGRTSLDMQGGTVENTATGNAVYNDSYNYLFINGTVSAKAGCALYSNYFAEIFVGTMAKVTSANTNTARGTIYLASNETPYYIYSWLRIYGTVENTSAGTGNAVRNDSSGDVMIYDAGKVSKAGNGNYAVYKFGSGAVTINAGATIIGNNYGL